MDMDVEDICIDSKKNEKQIDDEIEFSSKIITKFIPDTYIYNTYI
jgi:hypothetical protein